MKYSRIAIIAAVAMAVFAIGLYYAASTIPSLQLNALQAALANMVSGR